MTDTNPRRRFEPSLATRIFLVTSLLVTLAVGAAVAVTYWIVQRTARRAASEALESSSSVQTAFQAERYERLRLISRLFAADPAVAAYLAERDTRSILDLLGERGKDLGFDFAIFLDPTGKVIARTDRPRAVGQDLSQRPLLQKAITDFEAAGVWAEEGNLYYAVAQPLSKDSLLGFLVTGFAINDLSALQVHKISSADVAFVVDTDDQPRVVATTLPRETVDSLIAALKGRKAMMDRLMSGESIPRADLSVRGEPWIALLAPLKDANGKTVGFSVALASLEKELATYRRIETVLLLAGIVSILLASVFSFGLARRTLAPIRRLLSATEAARQGDYDQKVGSERNDEVGRLGRAFDDLLSDLREKRDMEAYVAELSRSLPEPGEGRARRRPAAPDAPLGVSTPEAKTAVHAAVSTLSGIEPGALMAHRFEILSILGAGGMGVVYKARDRELDDLVALKMLKRELWGDRGQLERLKSEIKLARKITHPNVLRTFDFGEIDGIPYLSMEYVRGVTLRYLLDQTHRLPYSAGLRLGKQLCAGLEAAHAVGVIHRDIKPENLILTPAGNAKLMDFGIARPIERTAPGQTQVGFIVGTPQYLAPEIVQGREADARSDLYSTGVVLYEIFTGELPFSAPSSVEILMKHLQEQPAAPRTHWPEIPPRLEQIILRCLEKDPQKRYATMAELHRELEGLTA